jgi:ferredoxin
MIFFEHESTLILHISPFGSVAAARGWERRTMSTQTRSITRSGRREFAVAGAAIALGVGGCATKPGASAEKTPRWGMVIDLKRCVACQACTVACKMENKTPPAVAYGVFVEEEHGRFPHVHRRAFFRPCMQCAHTSCVYVCPTGHIPSAGRDRRHQLHQMHRMPILHRGLSVWSQVF